MTTGNKTIVLYKGNHDAAECADGKRCLFEWYNWLTRQQDTDTCPPGVSPLLHIFGTRLNDALPDDRRQELIFALPNGGAFDGGLVEDGAALLGMDQVTLIFQDAERGEDAGVGQGRIAGHARDNIGHGGDFLFPDHFHEPQLGIGEMERFRTGQPGPPIKELIVWYGRADRLSIKKLIVEGLSKVGRAGWGTGAQDGVARYFGASTAGTFWSWTSLLKAARSVVRVTWSWFRTALASVASSS